MLNPLTHAQSPHRGELEHLWGVFKWMEPIGMVGLSKDEACALVRETQKRAEARSPGESIPVIAYRACQLMKRFKLLQLRYLDNQGMP